MLQYSSQSFHDSSFPCQCVSCTNFLFDGFFEFVGMVSWEQSILLSIFLLFAFLVFVATGNSAIVVVVVVVVIVVVVDVILKICSI